MPVATEVEAVAQAFKEGAANQDPAALGSLYADDAKLLPPGAPVCEGRPAIEEFMQGMIGMGARSLDVQPLETTDAGDLIIEYGRYELQMEPEGGEPTTDVGKYVVIHQRQDDGSTKIVLDCFNSDSAPS